MTDSTAHSQASEKGDRPADAPGVCSWSLQPMGTRDLDGLVAACGLNRVQLALVPLVEQPRDWARAAESLRQSGVDVVSGMFQTAAEDYSTLESIRRTGGLRPDEPWPATLESALRVADLAQEISLDLVSFHAGFIPPASEDPEGGVLMERLATIVDLFDARGIRIALETGQETAATLLEALAELNRPSVGVNFDPANMILYGMGDPVEAIRSLAPHVMQVHIKDALPAATPGEWGSEVPVGEGAVDWDGFFDALAECTSDVPLMIEREAGENRVGDIESAHAFVAAQLDRRRTAGERA